MKKFMVLATDAIGKGNDELGAILTRVFLTCLGQGEEVPEVLALMNAGVKLACEGSEVLDELRAVEARGVKIKACGTCLDFFGIREQLMVGEAGKMPDTVAALMTAEDSIVIS
ncbi:MAG: sulfurtransferase-like selenium metabolism protein YedF [Coriobacteriia bacterium]|nr:sulfurtransferase-like selenium metabolism protein YedF [Coriobacteriia bacterium]